MGVALRGRRGGGCGIVRHEWGLGHGVSVSVPCARVRTSTGKPVEHVVSEEAS